jgi:hypothetical protein
MSNKGHKVTRDDRKSSALGGKRLPSEENNEDLSKQKKRVKKAKAGMPIKFLIVKIPLNNLWRRRGTSASGAPPATLDQR